MKTLVKGTQKTTTTEIKTAIGNIEYIVADLERQLQLMQKKVEMLCQLISQMRSSKENGTDQEGRLQDYRCR